MSEEDAAIRSGAWPDRVAVRAARLFDGTTLRTGPGVTVLIEAGRITAVDLTGADLPEGLPVHDYPDATMLPGLIDTHTHLVFDASPDPAAHVQDASTEQLERQLRDVAAEVLRRGITTVRDLGDRDYLSVALRTYTAERPAAGPTVLAAGPPLTPTGGHCWFLGGCADGGAGLRRAIAEHAERGVDVIKVMATGGRMTPTTQPYESQYTAAELALAAESAHRFGLPIAAHVHGGQGIVDAVAAGVDTLEHVSFMTADGFAPEQKVIDSIAAADIICSVTAGVLPGAQIPAALARNLPAMRAHIKNLHDSGVRICLGPDGGVSPGKPHTVLPYALTELVDAGINAADVLTAATVTAADACRIADHAGRIAVGYDADLLFVAGNPLTDITTILAPVAVYRHGKRVSQVIR